MLRTYDEWKSKGFQVRKGEKCVGKNKQGKALFSDKQVKTSDEVDYDFEEMAEFYSCFLADRDW